MTAQRKIFRIEQMSVDGVADPAIDFRVSLEADALSASPGAAVSDIDAGRRHHELLAEVKGLRALLEPKEDAHRVLENYQTQLAEMQKNLEAARKMAIRQNPNASVIRSCLSPEQVSDGLPIAHATVCPWPAAVSTSARISLT